jgi:hypothetical protein
LISSAAEGEEGVPRRISEDLTGLAGRSGKFLFDHLSASSLQHFCLQIDTLEAHASRGLRPILHLDMHGNLEHGLQLGKSEEFIAWNAFVEMMRRINIASGGNLLVVLTACHGIRAIMPVSLKDATPFFALIAPKEEIRIWQIEEGVYPFYKSLIEEESLDGSLAHLGNQFQYFHSEKMLVVSLARYIRQHCVGRGGRERRERLLTDLFLNSTIQNNRYNRRKYRKEIKAFLTPSQELLDKYAEQFLLGRKCSVTMADIERELRDLRS